MPGTSANCASPWSATAVPPLTVESVPYPPSSTETMLRFMAWGGGHGGGHGGHGVWRVKPSIHTRMHA